MHSAIAQSCDVYFYGVAERLGIDRLHDFLAQFGLGAATGIDIGGERSALLPSREWKKKAFKRKDLQVWFPGETVIAGIGQGYMLATPLQLAHVAATISMRGKRFAPRLVTRIRDSSTGKIRNLPPRELPPVKVSDPDALGRDHRRHGRRDATTGTARRAACRSGRRTRSRASPARRRCSASSRTRSTRSRRWPSACATTALFIAFAPADDPRIAVAVVVENGRSGSGTAGPIARKVIDAYLLPDSIAGPHDWRCRITATGAPPNERGAPTRRSAEPVVRREEPRNEDRDRRTGLLEPRAPDADAHRAADGRAAPGRAAAR